MSFLLMVVVLALLSLLGQVSAVPYHMQNYFHGSTFFDNFNFATTDPSDGYVTYRDGADAFSNGLVFVNPNGTAHLGVNCETVDSGTGRRSVRVESKMQFNEGLLVGDFAHIPGDACGMWPAFWMYGPQWPKNGEIDIIEGVNRQGGDRYTLHTSPGCTVDGVGGYAQFEGQCNCNSASGCVWKGNNLGSYRDFNQGGGGMYAMQWTHDHIAIWNFPHDATPPDLQFGHNVPDPATWGEPDALFAGAGCDFQSHFRNMNVILNIDFCGTWAGSVAWDSRCSSGGTVTCEEYVDRNPGAYADAYWEVRSIAFYLPQAGTTPEIIPGELGGKSSTRTISTTLSVNDAMGAKETPVLVPFSGMMGPQVTTGLAG